MLRKFRDAFILTGILVLLAFTATTAVCEMAPPPENGKL